MITYGSVCSGIESASVAWEPLGFKPLWFSEIEAFPCAVLKHHWPEIPNLGDMLTLPGRIRNGEIPAPEILVGGTPCQAFSVAGKQGSLDDDRGQLTLAYVDIADAIDEKRDTPCTAIWENVPGVLTTRYNAFGCFLAKLSGSTSVLTPGNKPEVGKQNTFWRWDKKQRIHIPRWSSAGTVSGPKRSIAWRTLDAQYFGVAQRRRRVFVVASARDGFDPAEVLFEREGLRRDIAPSREKESIVAALTAQGIGTCGADDNQGQAGHLIHTHRMVAFGEYVNDGTASTLKARDYKDATDLVSTLNASSGKGKNGQDVGCLIVPDTQAPAVRRLTPLECERLQGFPDNHTWVPYRNKPACDGPRYKAVGNSKAVPIVRWIGARYMSATIKPIGPPV